ncbi:RNA polymerase sigma factor [Tsukamurella sp. 1534]|uniref:RNA polymerase sigma factor n=1 Tax=Tsukamurella sp. 1534 TaxID=1151061 RepID=UPI000319B141|nr:sigma-70 family RNA polymerase sigma factor [Tsukamurella sp. 1534]
MEQEQLLAALPDETLARRAQRGDATAFDELVRRHVGALYRFVVRTCPPGTDCEDIVQESLLGAWRALPEFAFRSSVRTWFYSIAAKRTADALRRRRPTADDTAFEERPAAEPGPEKRAADRDFLDALGRALGRLPFQARATWWLKEVDGMSIAEIAAVLHTTEGSVRGHLQRTRARLAEELDDYRP